jgi:hypothetical protein
MISIFLEYELKIKKKFQKAILPKKDERLTKLYSRHLMKISPITTGCFTPILSRQFDFCFTKYDEILLYKMTSKEFIHRCEVLKAFN